jgi:hypothetical protein
LGAEARRQSQEAEGGKPEEAHDHSDILDLINWFIIY